jgi:bifunctional pyridoxal-dependent enzyme with beta-cystathionase and maltose regulon repressor activities
MSAAHADFARQPERRGTDSVKWKCDAGRDGLRFNFGSTPATLELALSCLTTAVAHA